jgi:hypothetical protein
MPGNGKTPTGSKGGNYLIDVFERAGAQTHHKYLSLVFYALALKYLVSLLLGQV